MDKQAENTKSFHSRPRVSASRMHVYSQCEASFAREVEAFNCFEANGVPFNEDSEAARSGTLRHEALAAIPVLQEGIDFFEEARKACEVVGLPIEDGWLIAKMAKLRDGALQAIVAANAPLRNVQVYQDNERLFKPYKRTTEELSGLPDLFVTMEGRDKKIAFICDYKTGFGVTGSADANWQIKTLVRLGAEKFNLDEVYGMVIDRESIDAESIPKIAVWNKAAIGVLTDKVDKAFNRAVGMVKLVPSGDQEISEKANAKLDAAANAGSHCLHCKGLVCCTKLQKTIAEFQWPEEASILGESIVGRKNSKKVYEMTKEQLRDGFAAIKPYSEQAHLVQQVLEKMKDAAAKFHEAKVGIEGIEFVEGSRAGIAPGETTGTVFEKLLSLGIVNDSPESYGEFIETVSNVKASELRAFLATKLAIPEKMVIERLKEDCEIRKLSSPLVDTKPLSVKLEIVEEIEAGQPAEMPTQQPAPTRGRSR